MTHLFRSDSRPDPWLAPRLVAWLLAGALAASGCASGSDGAGAPVATAGSTPANASSTTTAPTANPPSTSEGPTMTNESEPTTTRASATTPDDDVTEPGAPCRRLDDFEHGADGDEWFVVDDGVMGGRSNGSVEIGESTMRFSGSVVTDGGGFTSVRLRLGDGAMAGSSRLAMRVRSDDRVYGITLEDDAEANQRSVSHRADLDTTGPTDDDGWTVATLDYAELRPSVFGRAVEAPPFDPDAAREIGIIIADGRDGDFSLEVDWIDVCD